MKNTVAVLGLSAVLFLSACKKTEAAANREAVTETAGTLAVDSVKTTDSSVVNEKLSAVFSSKILIFPDIIDKNLQDSIYFLNKGITDFSKAGILNHLEKNKEEYFTSVKNMGKELLSASGRKQTWNSDSYMNLKSYRNGFLHIEYAFSSYEGGAHNNYGFYHRVFDLNNSRKMQLKDITSMPKGRLEDLLKKNINTISSGTTDSQGRVNNADMLLVEVIPATDNFYFDDKNLYFHYSPYEIAAFAAGDITVPVSWEELKGTLNAQFRERMKIK